MQTLGPDVCSPHSIRTDGANRPLIQGAVVPLLQEGLEAETWKAANLGPGPYPGRADGANRPLAQEAVVPLLQEGLEAKTWKAAEFAMQTLGPGPWLPPFAPMARIAP